MKWNYGLEKKLGFTSNFGFDPHPPAPFKLPELGNILVFFGKELILILPVFFVLMFCSHTHR